MTEATPETSARAPVSSMERHLARNVTAQLVSGALGQTASRLVQAPTFLPAFLFTLSGSELLVGLARALQAVGTVPSPMIGAALIGHRDRILGPVLTLGALMRLQMLGLSLAAFLLAGQAAFAAVVAFLALMGFCQGMAQVATHSLRAKVIPVGRRGLVSGLRHLLAGTTAAAASWLAGAYVLEPDLLGNGYGMLFLLAFAAGMLGLAGLAATREPDAVAVRTRQGVGAVWRQVPDLLRGDPDFARFFLARAFGASGRMAMPFYVLYASTSMELDGRDLGVLTMAWIMTASVSNLVWGMLADRYGYRIVMVVTLTIWSVSQVQVLLVADRWDLVAFFVAIGIAQGGFNQAAQNIVLEFGATQDIPLRLATSGTAVNVVAAIGPLVGGVLVTVHSYQALFLTCFALQILGLALLRRVPEPRRGVLR